MIDVNIMGHMSEDTWYKIADWLDARGITPIGYVTLYNRNGWPCAIIGESSETRAICINSIDMFSLLDEKREVRGTCFSFSDYQKSQAIQFKMKFLN